MLNHLFTPPKFEDEELTHQAYLLHVILLVVIISPILFVVYLLVQKPEETERALTIIGAAELINIILFLLLRLGYVRLASFAHIAILWLTFAVSSVTSSSIYGLAYMLGNGLTITIAGILLGGRGAFSMTLLAILEGGVLVYAELYGWVPPDVLDDPLTTWIVVAVLFVIGAGLQNLASREVRMGLSLARESEERYRLISRVSSDYTFSTAVDTDGNMHLNWVAGAFEEITGYKFEEYVANGGWLAHLHPDDLEQDARDMEAIRKNQKVTTEVRTFTKNRGIRWVRVYGHPVWDHGNNMLKGIVGAVQDITIQKLNEEREATRQTLLEIVLDLGKQVTETTNMQGTLNQIWHGIHDELEFDRTAVFLHNPESNSMDSMIGTDIHGKMEDTSGIRFPISESTNFRMVLDKPDGVYFTHNYDAENNIPEGNEMFGVKDYAAVAAWSGDKPVAVICVDNLLTQRRITEEQLEALRLFSGYAGLAIENSRLNESLQVELNQRQNLIDELEAKNAELERFTYTVSHDLKSPLVTITGFLGFLEQDTKAGNIDGIKKSIDRISNAAKKMQSLMNDLLELSRVGRLVNAPEDIAFAGIVSEALDHVRGQLDRIKAVVKSQNEYPTVHGDRVRLVEVVQNLIDNAAKYSSPNKTPHIEIGTNGNDKNGFPVFYVRDNGIGIEKKYHDQIFGLFNKLDIQSEGTGIGLSLVKRIIEVHNGRIWVESEAGNGATFFFTLPTPKIKE